jgi:hypothetical protein
MPKFEVQQKRLVTEVGHAVVDVPQGVAPITYVEGLRAVGEDPLQWETLSTADMSMEVTPVPEPVSVSSPLSED